MNTSLVNLFFGEGQVKRRKSMNARRPSASKVFFTFGNEVADGTREGFLDYVGSGRKRPKTIRLCVKMLDQT